MSVEIDQLPPRWAAKITSEHRQDLVDGLCWIWTGTLHESKGYGLIRVDGRTTTAHRAIYLHIHGPVADGIQIDHLCRVRPCVNPAHMEPVTNRENCLRAKSLIMRCRNGHPLVEPNLLICKRNHSGNSSRYCRICQSDALRRFREKRSPRTYVKPSFTRRREQILLEAEANLALLETQEQDQDG